MEKKKNLTDKNKCKGCLYASTFSGMVGCAYMLTTGNPRNTRNWEDCYLHEGTEYVPKGKKSYREIGIERSKQSIRDAGKESNHFDNFDTDRKWIFIDKLKRRYNDVQR